MVEMTAITKSYTVGYGRLPVLRKVNLTIRQGEFVAVMGPSGSGKSTMLHILGCLDRPDSGSYLLDGRDILAATDSELSQTRARRIGFVFQTFNLIHNLSVKENVELPFLYHAAQNGDGETRILSAIEQVGLAGRIAHKPYQLSGGEMQRAAIARAIATDPRLLLADEPTGNLDSSTGREILDLFETLNDAGATIVMVTHNQDVAGRAGRVMTLNDGRFA
ncbi:MAG: macrolide ABC transporter ATP-binding protein [Deltaproteobacteria bacterium SG8_13]|nr:MAG: macrolide ABC transporter ATP-binding protein [Deltaproteobacteria bacterium SG8_13]